MTVEKISKTTRLYIFEEEIAHEKSAEFTHEDRMYYVKRLEQIEILVNNRLIKKWAVSYYLLEIDTLETVLIERRIYKSRNAAANQFRKS